MRFRSACHRSYWTCWFSRLSAVVSNAIGTAFVEELSFLAKYDETKNAIQDIVDMPDRQIDLFIRFCLRNNGRLSAHKRGSQLYVLSDEEAARHQPRPLI